MKGKGDRIADFERTDSGAYLHERRTAAAWARMIKECSLKLARSNYPAQLLLQMQCATGMKAASRGVSAGSFDAQHHVSDFGHPPSLQSAHGMPKFSVQIRDAAHKLPS